MSDNTRIWDQVETTDPEVTKNLPARVALRGPLSSEASGCTRGRTPNTIINSRESLSL